MGFHLNMLGLVIEQLNHQRQDPHPPHKLWCQVGQFDCEETIVFLNHTSSLWLVEYMEVPSDLIVSGPLLYLSSCEMGFLVKDIAISYHPVRCPTCQSWAIQAGNQSVSPQNMGRLSIWTCKGPSSCIINSHSIHNSAHCIICLFWFQTRRFPY